MTISPFSTTTPPCTSRAVAAARRATRCVLRASILALLTQIATPAGATVLTFDQVRSSVPGNPVIPTISGLAVPEGYGDRVSSAAMDVPGGTFTYGQAGEGFTPNVVADFFSGSASPVGPGVSLWQDGYGDLTNVLFGNNNSQFLAVRFTADAGFRVGLYGFDLGGWPNSDYVIDAVRVRGDSTLLFESLAVLVHGATTGPGRTTFGFATPLYDTDVVIEIDYRNLPGSQHDNIGIDNIRFGQSPPAPGDDTNGEGQLPSVPEPSTLLLLGTALLHVVARRRRSRTTSVHQTQASHATGASPTAMAPGGAEGVRCQHNLRSV